MCGEAWLSMSKAFVRESEADDNSSDLPDRPISSHPNLVTAAGLALMEEKLVRLHADHAAAQDAQQKSALAAINRDLRYWTSRRATAQLVDPPENPERVEFGTTVTIERDDGRTQSWRIVGEDEAEPANGTLSFASPVARALMGKAVGDTVSAGTTEATILSID